jgi:hypothetical protein
VFKASSSSDYSFEVIIVQSTVAMNTIPQNKGVLTESGIIPRGAVLNT